MKFLFNAGGGFGDADGVVVEQLSHKGAFDITEEQAFFFS